MSQFALHKLYVEEPFYYILQSTIRYLRFTSKNAVRTSTSSTRATPSVKVMLLHLMCVTDGSREQPFRLKQTGNSENVCESFRMSSIHLFVDSVLRMPTCYAKRLTNCVAALYNIGMHYYIIE